MQWDVAQRADGSVSWQQGSSQVQAAVFGPVQGPAWLADPEQASVQVIWSGRGGMAGLCACTSRVLAVKGFRAEAERHDMSCRGWRQSCRDADKGAC